MKGFLKRRFPKAFYALKRWRNAQNFRRAHGGAEYRAKQALVTKFGQKVLGGPFAGLTYGNDVLCGAYVAKLVGSYEEELHDVVQRILARSYRRIIDVGCAEGYYAVGLAWRFPQAHVLAYDTDGDALKYCADLARLNGVANRVELRGYCDHAELAANCGEGTLVVCDCEGFELELLDPSLVPDLAETDLLVELHEFMHPGLTAELVARFSSTHHVELIDSRDRRIEDYPVLDVVPAADRSWAVREGRPASMQWLFVTARASASLAPMAARAVSH